MATAACEATVLRGALENSMECHVSQVPALPSTPGGTSGEHISAEKKAIPTRRMLKKKLNPKTKKTYFLP